MIYDLYLFTHDTLGICFWTLMMIPVGVIMIIMALVHGHNQKKRGKEFDKKMENQFSAERA